ncbi:MAG: hybrid sensor histidine kinase/response regulator [Okeania sp. SIO3B5]|uniref:ATP-binding response regulator n=1 Tax=Okeania sp. SIO3B5 TaxID=2607811 RepID=UPI001400F746|nr:hybrid sensor histidine kinase/response regulator [Okeania sp. SIO3B5]NEO54647.1 hybrid sensor histidine kinase/response regulator [Okeania sp. SIO3B5]
MSMAYTTLKKFVYSIPICLHTENLQVVWSIFCKEKYNELVVVNHQYKPLGLIYLHNLIPDIDLKPENQSSQNHALTLNWQKPLSEVDSLTLNGLRVLSADLTITQLWPYLQAQSEGKINEESDTLGIAPPSTPIAVVDKAGKFLGLLDTWYLLEFIATNQVLEAKLSSKNSISAPENLINTYGKFLPTPTPNKNLPQTTADTSSYHYLLLDLLETLPLPLMLQNNEGEIIKQNLAWRSQITKESDLMKIADAVVSLSSKNIKQQPGGVTMPDSLAVVKDMITLSCPATTNWRFSPATLLQERAKLPELNSASSFCYYTQPNTYLCTCPQKNGQERVWQFSSQPLFDLTLILAQDITEQRLIAKELEAKNADLIQLNRLKDEFLACISHELKTPLTAVLGLSSLLKEQALGSLNERQARYAQLIHESGRHLMAVVNDILDLTRMETGQMELNSEPVNIKKVCDRAFQDALQLQNKSLQDSYSSSLTDSLKTKYTLEIESDLNSFIADELRLRQMLVNLLSNAFKFTPADGKMGLKVAKWEKWITFTVWDRGIGIPANKQHLIFQKFQQLENPLTRQFEGTGLGLVLTQRLARLHGGDVTFISQEGKGSEFTLILPPSPPPKDLGTEGWETNDYLKEKGLIPTRKSEVGTKKYNKLPVNNYQVPVINYSSRLVLIVEAVPRFIEDLTSKLTGLGYRVVIARSGTEAVEKARKLQPKFIFLNPLLPLLSGWDVLTLLKTDIDTCQIPVVITATRGDKERAINNGANRFLSLPVEQLGLEEILAEFPDSASQNHYQKLVILRLVPGKHEFQQSTEEDSIYEGKFLSLPGEYTVIEADDLAQANLLAKIWQPNVILIEKISNSVNSVQFIQKLSRYSTLTAIPLVTLDSETTQVANQFKQLSVFPCLAFEKNDNNLTETKLDDEYLTSALCQVISIAAGMSWKPTILVMDVANITDLTAPLKDILSHKAKVSLSDLNQERKDLNLADDTFNSPSFSAFIPHVEVGNQNWDEITQESGKDSEKNKLPIDSTQVLVQYLETSGFKSLIGKSWIEVWQQLQNQSVDLLLICLQDKLPLGLDQALSNLEQIVAKPPILVLENSNSQLPDNLTQKNLSLVLSKIATKILPSDLSIADLLEEIKHHLTFSAV